MYSTAQGSHWFSLCSTSDRSAAFAAVVDDGVGVLVDHGAAARAPAEPHLRVREEKNRQTPLALEDAATGV